MDTESRRLTSALNSTPTGQGLLNGALVMPITDSARTDTVGVPRGAVNLYRDGTQLVLQAFDFDSGAWRSTRLGTGGAIVAWDDITGKPTEFPPEAHADTHENGGDDEIDVTGLSGLLADGQTPLSHASTHQNGGADEISVAGLSGELADAQPPKAHASSHSDGGTDEIDAGDLGSGAATDGQVLTADGLGGAAWETPGSGAPTDANYLVGSANGSLSNEIVVGTTPGGELGGTWASPTVDTTHSGSSHSEIQTAAETTAANALSAHAGDPDAHHDWPLADGDIPSTIARDSEVTAAINAITPGDIGAPVAEAGAGSIWVQSSEPTANATGDLWIETA